MRICTMLLLIMFITAAVDIGGASMRNAHLSKRAILFFLFSVWVMSLFEYKPLSELSLNPACILTAIWLYGASFAYRESHAAASIPLAAILGVFGALVIISGIEGAEYIAGLIIAIPSLFMDTLSSLASAAFMPLFSALYIFAYSMFISGYGVVEMTDTALSVQLIGFAIVFVIKSALQSRVRKEVGVP